QPDRADRQHHRKPAQRENEFRGPVHRPVLEQERADREERGHRGVLHEIAAAPVDRAAIAALIERAERDADQRDHRGEPAQARLPRHRTVVQDHQHPAEVEHQAAPLQRRHLFAEPAVGDGRGQDRLQARNQRGEAGRNRMRDRDRGAAEIEAVNENAGNGAVGKADP
ncbi:hypothetical protein KXW38_001308, partial [Aspergillus fumigatus]